MKTNKIFAAALTLTLTAGAAIPFNSFIANAANTARQNYIRGDVNGDKDVDIEDANAVINHVNGVSALSIKQIAAADANRDNVIDIEDATTILNQINGVSPIKDNKFIISGDNWAFTNSGSNFDITYHISNKDMNILKSKASNIDYANIKEYSESGWSGSCYGMAVTSILANHDIIKAGDYKKGADFIHEITEPTEEVKSLINYYHVIQVSYDIDFLRNYYYNDLDEKTKVEKLLKCLEDGSPTLVCSRNNDGWGGHAVVAYGVEHGTFKRNGRTYNCKVLIYNVNDDVYTDDSNLYVDSDKGTWSFENDRCSEGGGHLGLVTDDLNILNYLGLYGKTSDIEVSNLVAFLKNETDNAFKISKATEKNGVWTKVKNTNDNMPDDIKTFPTYEGDEDNTSVTYSFSDIKSGYILDNSKAEAFDYSLTYKDSMLKANASSASKAMFAPSNSVSVSGDATDYELGIVLNDELTVNDWFGISVGGKKADDATLRKAKDGFIFKASDMTDISVEAYNKDVSANLTFSTTYPEVLLYEKDINTIGVAVDKDKNGTFETTLSFNGDEIAVTLSGDANCDSVVDMSDVVLVMQALSNPDKYGINGTNEKHITKQGWINCDVDKTTNGLTANDALRIQEFLLGKSSELS